jgi:ABC-2 type transport system ATP-binding protein
MRARGEITPMPGEHAIAVSGVDKVYRGGVHALRGVDLNVHPGEVFGLLGPNGAGKSTLIKILMTVIRPSRCKGHMLDKPIGHKPTLGHIGYLPEHHSFPGYLTGAQVLDFYGAMAGVHRRERKRRVPELLELVSMKEWAGKKVKGYSKGMRQRVGIAQALMNNPKLVLLDEPTDGVDPVGRRDIRDIVLRLKQEGRAVFLNSHLLSELEMVTDRVAILVKGKVAMQGTIDELTVSKLRYEITLVPPAGESGPEARTAFGRRVADALPGQMQQTELTVEDCLIDLGNARRSADDAPIGFAGAAPGGERVEVFGNTIAVAGDDPALAQPLLDGLRAAGHAVASMRVRRPSLEDLFLKAVTDLETGEAFKPGANNTGRRDRKRAEAAEAKRQEGGAA